MAKRIKYTVSADDVAIITGYRETIKDAMIHALAVHTDSILPELAAFDRMRESNPQRWAQLTIIKSILSSGADLDPNIALAKLLTDTLRGGIKMSSYDDAEQYRAACKYGGRSVGANINAALLSWNMSLRNIEPAMMTWETLTKLRKERAIMGHADKTRSWSLALYDHRNRVYTLDVHMLRALLRFAGYDADNLDPSIASGNYKTLAAFMLDIHDEVSDLSPLVSQWSMWNEERHPNVHAPHIALAD